MHARQEKHLSYFSLMKSLEENNCPICCLIKGGIEQYFDTLLYENVNDRDFRQKFRENGGFCNYHSYQFAHYNDGLAIAIAHRIVLADTIDDVSSGKLHLHKKHHYSVGKKHNCIVCKLAREMETRYLSVILEYMEDEDFKNKLLNSHGLCVVHYEKLLRSKSADIPKWFKAFHVDGFNAILVGIDKYIASCNYTIKKSKHELSREESLVWKRVVELLYGFEGYTIKEQ